MAVEAEEPMMPKIKRQERMMAQTLARLRREKEEEERRSRGGEEDVDWAPTTPDNAPSGEWTYCTIL